MSIYDTDRGVGERIIDQWHHSIDVCLKASDENLFEWVI